MIFEVRVEMRIRSLLYIQLLVFALSLNGAAQGYVDILPDEVKNPFYERHERISKELVNPPANEWVGRYGREIGPTWSEVFIWEPQAGFAAFRDTCSNGPRAWVNHGDVRFRDGVLTISPARAKDEQFVLAFPFTEYTPIKWGQQHWLVPTDQLTLFAYAVNSRSGDAYEIGYLKVDDGENRQTKHPNLPQQYLPLLSLPPIRTKVVAIGEKTDKWFPQMVIDAGKDKGVIEEMSFWLLGHKGIQVKITVNEVRERTSIVSVTSWGLTQAFDREIKPALGWRFTSRLPYRY